MDRDRDARNRRFERYQPYSYEDYAREPKRGRWLYRFFAAFSLTAGVGLMGLAGYVYWESQQGNDAWVYVRPSFEDPDVAVAAAARGPAPLGASEYRLVIEKLGVDVPVAPFGMDQNAVPEIPYEGDLVAWYTFSAPPGTGENAVFAGHKTWDGEAVFYRLGELAAGDNVTLIGQDGTRLIYQVSGGALVEPGVDAARQWMDPAGADVITLITCGGERFEIDDPLGADYTHRQVVRGDLIAVQPPG
jgi:LPXTG-site transpeptidase (sortase) family protein